MINARAMETRSLPSVGQVVDLPLPIWVKISAAYLFLPLALFIGGWMKLWLALPLLACILGSLGTMLAHSGSRWPSRPAILSTIGIAVIAIAFATLSGISTWVPQSTDYLKHNLILGDLIERPWPVRYPGEHGDRFLCYGLGYYMVPATIARFLGSSQVGIASFVWACLGLILSFVGLGRRFTSHPKLGVVLFLLCSGLGVFWTAIKSGFVQSLISPHSTGGGPGEDLMSLGIYTSNLDSFTRILYQPQHGIVAWLGGVLIYELIIVRGRWTEAAAILATTLFWSPLTSLGLAVVGVAALIAKPGSLKFRPSIHLVTSLAITGMLVAYYLPHVSIAEKGFIWEVTTGASWPIWYLFFLLCFVLIPVSSIGWIEKNYPYLGAMKPVVIGMTVVLILSPLFKLGQLGDLRMQISGPAFLFIAIAMVKGIIEAPLPRKSAAYAYLLLVFLAGALFPLLRAVEHLRAAGKTDYSIATLRKEHLNSLMDLRMPGFDVTAQYLGQSDSKAAELILKPSASKDGHPQ
jgi:hypothetical protein